jgi:hypothetical protein
MRISRSGAALEDEAVRRLRHQVRLQFRRTFSCAHWSAFDSLRQGLRHLRSADKAELEEGYSDTAGTLREYQERTFADLDRPCERAPSTIDRQLPSNIPTPTARAFCHKLVEDFSRYNSECALESEMSKS